MPRPSKSSQWNIAQLEQILAERRKELKKLSRQRTNLEHQMMTIDQRIQALGGETDGRRGTRSRPKNSDSLANVMALVLRDAGKPLRVDDIVAGVRAKGYKSGSDNFKSIVNQQLIKDERFDHFDRGIYQLKK